MYTCVYIFCIYPIIHPKKFTRNKWINNSWILPTALLICSVWWTGFDRKRILGETSGGAATENKRTLGGWQRHHGASRRTGDWMHSRTCSEDRTQCFLITIVFRTLFFTSLKIPKPTKQSPTKHSGEKALYPALPRETSRTHQPGNDPSQGYWLHLVCLLWAHRSPTWN